MSLNGLARLAPPPPPVWRQGTSYPLEGFSLPPWLRRLLGLPLQGRITPDRPGASLQAPPKPDPKPVRPLAPKHPIVGHGPFQCGYCGRYGQPGACEGCGAPNAPAPEPEVPARRPDTILRMHEAGILTPNEARVMLGAPPLFPENRVVKG